MNYRNSDSMRRDALRRTREMHRQNTGFAHMNVQAQNRQPSVNIPASGQDVRDKPQLEFEKSSGSEKKTYGKAADSGAKKSMGFDSLFSGLFHDGKPDNDKIIIIALIVLLAKEGADIKLLLALGYILM